MSEEINSTGQTGKFLSANIINIYYESFGSGKSLIFLHGSMGTGKVWMLPCDTLIGSAD